MKNLIYAITLFSAPLFFGGTAILGIDYEGLESSNIFRNYCIAVFTISMLCFILDKKKAIRSRTNFILFLILFYYIFTGYITGFGNHSSMLSFIAFSLPATCIGMYYANDRKETLFKIVRWIDVLFVILVTSVLFLSYRLLTEMLNNEHYYSQQLSYYSSLCFLLDVFLIFYGKKFNPRSIFRKIFFRLVYYCLLPVFIIVIFFSGGRGGLVVVVVGTIFIVFVYNKVKWKNWVWGSLTIISVALLLTQIEETPSNEFTEHFDRNQQRVISYIQLDNEEGEEMNVSNMRINMSETSGRDMVYSQSWKMFLQRPITGYGLFRYKRYLMYRYNQPYPHNLFLEWLLQGGIIFFGIWFYIFVKWIKRLHHLIKDDIRYILLLPFFIYALVMLMFSGSYMGTPFFWFTLSFVFNKHIALLKTKSRIRPYLINNR